MGIFPCKPTILDTLMAMETCLEESNLKRCTWVHRSDLEIDDESTVALRKAHRKNHGKMVIEHIQPGKRYVFFPKTCDLLSDNYTWMEVFMGTYLLDPHGYLYLSYFFGYFDGYSDGYLYGLVMNHTWGHDWVLTGVSGHNCGETYPGSCLSTWTASVKSVTTQWRSVHLWNFNITKVDIQAPHWIK